jgi:hypothetical protein
MGAKSAVRGCTKGYRKALKRADAVHTTMYDVINQCNLFSVGPLAATLMGERGGANRVLMWRPDGKRSLERPRRRWEDDIKMDFREVGCGHGLDKSGSG